MKVLFIGPYPPPYGGVSVHVRNAHAILSAAGVPCRVLETRGRRFRFLRQLFEHVFNDWTIHVHTNGHNRKSWILAAACGFGAQIGCGGVLTLHSGLLPDYLRTCSESNRTIARLACLLYNRVVCVNEEIAETLESLGIPSQHLKIMPAFLPALDVGVPVPGAMQDWISAHNPVLSTTLTFRPEYGFELLTAAVNDLREKFPELGCLVMGDGDHRDEAECLIRNLGLDNHVLLAGDVPNDLCLRLVSNSDIFVRSTYRDGDANSVREALALGVPVVASRIGQRPEGVLLFEPGDSNGLAAAIEQGLRPGTGTVKMKSETHHDYAEQLMTLYA